MSHELWKKYRPTAWKEIVGQGDILKGLVQQVKNKKVPHAILLAGPSGVGKTTIAYQLKRELKCGDNDFKDNNCATNGGIDMVRDVRLRMGLAPTIGDCRIYLFDEAHKLTDDAQSGLLKMMEMTPEHVYFILATTHPRKILPTILGRCSKYFLKPITPKLIEELIWDVAEKEKITVTEEAVEKIVNIAGGSAREALNILDMTKDYEDEEEQLNAIQAINVELHASELYQALLTKQPWSKVAKILKSMQDDAEGVRRYVLACATNGMLSSSKGPVKLIFDAFRDNFFDTNRAGLINACYEVCHA